MQLKFLLQNPPPRIRNKNILNRRVRNSQFEVKKLLPQFENVQVKQRARVVQGMFIRQKMIYPGKRNVQFEISICQDMCKLFARIYKILRY